MKCNDHLLVLLCIFIFFLIFSNLNKGLEYILECIITIWLIFNILAVKIIFVFRIIFLPMQKVRLRIPNPLLYSTQDRLKFIDPSTCLWMTLKIYCIEYYIKHAIPSMVIISTMFSLFQIVQDVNLKKMSFLNDKLKRKKKLEE